MDDTPMRSSETSTLGRLPYTLSIGMLFELGVPALVKSIRSRHGIVAPETAEELEYNREHHPLAEIIPEVEAGLARLRWPREIAHVRHLVRPEVTARWLRLIPGVGRPIAAMFLYTAPQLREKVLGPAVAAVAQYVVCGPLAPPLRAPDDLLQLVTTIPAGSDTILIAVASRFSKPRELANEFVARWHQLYTDGKPPTRECVSPMAERDAWVWVAYNTLKPEHGLFEDTTASINTVLDDAPDRELGRWAVVANWYCEVYPSPDQGEPDTPQRDAYVDHLIPTLRKAYERFRAYFRDIDDALPEHLRAPRDA